MVWPLSKNKRVIHSGDSGYVLIALVAASDQGLKSASMYMFIYLVMIIAVFSIILSLKKSEFYVDKISELSGLFENKKKLN